MVIHTPNDREKIKKGEKGGLKRVKERAVRITYKTLG